MPKRFFNNSLSNNPKHHRKNKTVRFENVGMDECHFVKGKKGLKTDGVTACIALVIRGYYYDEYNKKIAFCGLHHWSGFPNPLPADIDNAALSVLTELYDNCQDTFDLSEDTTISLSELSFIGGEKKQVDEQGNLILSGTEAEVSSLKKAWDSIKSKNDFWFKLINTELTEHNFLTEGETSITIRVTPDKVKYHICNEYSAADFKP